MQRVFLEAAVAILMAAVAVCTTAATQAGDDKPNDNSGQQELPSKPQPLPG